MAIGVPMIGWVADCSAAHPSVATLQAAGAVGVMRYLDPGRNDGTEITPEEIADYAANNFPYGLVMEYGADWLEGGYNVGHADALAALAEEQRLGIPHGIIYLACDFQIEPGQYAQALATMQGFADAYGGWQYVRPYGSKDFCEWVQANSPARGSWSTYAWSFNPALNQFEHAADARLWQYNFWPVAAVDGCDFNEILGDWGPRNQGDDLTPEQDNILRTTARAVVQLAGVIGQLVADEATRSKLITKGDDTHYGLLQVKADMQAIEAAVKAVPPGGGTDLAPVLAAINNLKLGAIQ